jgi:hypothetical protein
MSLLVNLAQKFPGFFLHFSFSIVVLFMVISDKMEQAVDEEPDQFFVERMPVFLSLSFGLMKIDDDVAENQVPCSVFRVPDPRFGLGEGKHIGSPVDAAIGAVKYPHPAIVYQEYTQFSFGKTEMQAGFPETVCYSPVIYLSAPLLVR